MEGVKEVKEQIKEKKVVPDTLECDDSGYPALEGSPLALCQIPGRLGRFECFECFDGEGCFSC